jgi:hypothetical protein
MRGEIKQFLKKKLIKITELEYKPRILIVNSLDLHLCLFVCLSISLYLCFSVSLPLRYSVSLSLCLSVSLSLCLSASMSLCLYVSLSLCLSVYLSLSLSLSDYFLGHKKVSLRHPLLHF